MFSSAFTGQRPAERDLFQVEIKLARPHRPCVLEPSNSEPRSLSKQMDRQFVNSRSPKEEDICSAPSMGHMSSLSTVHVFPDFVLCSIILLAVYNL